MQYLQERNGRHRQYFVILNAHIYVRMTVFIRPMHTGTFSNNSLQTIQTLYVSIHLPAVYPSQGYWVEHWGLRSPPILWDI